MCVGVPGEIIDIDGNEALVDFKGTRQKVRIDFVDDVEEGDYILNHVGHAIEVLPQEEAEKRLELFDEYLESLE
ncbi:MAG: Hydrogenase maturation factor HypC [Candidatus Methanohalarchaeum thermophilum]|uniref:Hydrogenase maturation factor HypC n=1 Tax=Methanohalarchaeum thermophilum TaxID=1903181 RepID=A0A1Q6DS45_METT1|nr:MAG: Hydrogenase maturation factor HypC [Candidatus Methanohalarchaeum thermophilum]